MSRWPTRMRVWKPSMAITFARAPRRSVRSTRRSVAVTRTFVTTREIQTRSWALRPTKIRWMIPSQLSIERKAPSPARKAFFIDWFLRSLTTKRTWDLSDHCRPVLTNGGASKRSTSTWRIIRRFTDKEVKIWAIESPTWTTRIRRLSSPRPSTFSSTKIRSANEIPSCRPRLTASAKLKSRNKNRSFFQIRFTKKLPRVCWRTISEILRSTAMKHRRPTSTSMRQWLSHRYQRNRRLLRKLFSSKRLQPLHRLLCQSSLQTWRVLKFEMQS